MRKMARRLALTMVLSMFVLSGCGASKKVSNNTAGGTSDKKVELSFYYPVAVGGAVTKTIEAWVSDFNTANPNIHVTPSFAGNYQDTMAKVQTNLKGGTPPDVVVLQATDIFTLVDGDAIAPLDDYINADKGGKDYINDFLPAFMANSKVSGKTWSVPFQRSTVVLYYNKEAFQKAGLTNPPKTWDELVSYGKQLTKDGQWGVEIPSDGNPSWTFSSFFIQNGKNVADENGTSVSFNAAEVVEALDFIQGLSKTHKIMPPGIIKWGDMTNDLANGKAAMIYHTTGSIGGLRKAMDSAKIGVAPLPAGKKGGSPTGGGNMYIMKTTKEKQEAAYKFMQFMTDTERVAKWSVETGYIPARKSAADTQTWKDAVKAFPGYQTAVDALQTADREIVTHANQEVLKAFGDQLQAVVNGTKPTKEAMDLAKKNAEAILKPYKK